MAETNKGFAASLKGARRAQQQVAQDILNDAQRMVPVDTGRLRESGHLDDEGGDGPIRVTFDAPYARYVEFGTSEQTASPYLTPSAFKKR